VFSKVVYLVNLVSRVNDFYKGPSLSLPLLKAYLSRSPALQNVKPCVQKN